MSLTRSLRRTNHSKKCEGCNVWITTSQGRCNACNPESVDTTSPLPISPSVPASPSSGMPLSPVATTSTATATPAQQQQQQQPNAPSHKNQSTTKRRPLSVAQTAEILRKLKESGAGKVRCLVCPECVDVRPVVPLTALLRLPFRKTTQRFNPLSACARCVLLIVC